MEASELSGILEFLRSTERLKDVTRSAYTSRGKQESVAEHTWRLSLMALVLAPKLPDIDFSRLIRICIVHDLGEAIGGDIPAPSQGATGGKSAQERSDLLELLRPLPAPLQTQLTELWDEYEEARSPEAKLAKALDKLETILQHNQGQNPAGFDFRFNLGYGRQYTNDPPLIAAIREMLDRETEERARDTDELESPGGTRVEKGGTT